MFALHCVMYLQYKRPPLCAMLTSPAVLALLTVCAADGFGFYIYANDLGLYLSQVLGYDIQQVMSTLNINIKRTMG